MRKWFFVSSGIAFLACIAVVFVMFIIPSINGEKFNNGLTIEKNNKTDVGKDYKNDLEKSDYLIYTKMPTNQYFVGDLVNVGNYLTCSNFNDYKIKIESNYNEIIDGLIISATTAGEYSFDITYTKDLVNLNPSYDKLDSFTLIFYDKISSVEIEKQSTAINVYDLKIMCDDYIDYGCISFDKSNINITKIENITGGIRLEVEIINDYTGVLIFKYNKVINNIVDIFEKVIDLCQDYSSYFKAVNETLDLEMKSGVEYKSSLYITKDAKNYDNYNAFNDIFVSNGLITLNKGNYQLLYDNEIVDVVELGNFYYRIKAKGSGETYFKLLYNDIELLKIKFNVIQFEIDSLVVDKYEYEIYVDEVVDLSPQVEINEYAPLTINYSVDNDDCTIEQGIFTPKSEGVFKVTVMVNDISYSVDITVVDKIIEDNDKIIYIYDRLTGDEVTEINTTVGENVLYTIGYESGFPDEASINDITYLVDSVENSNCAMVVIADYDLIIICFNFEGVFDFMLCIKGENYSTKVIKANITKKE